MPIKVDGTNGVLQAYDAQVLTTGFTYTFAAGTQTLIAVPAGTLATGTVTMPASPADGMVINIESTQQITALTVAANTGQTLVGGVVTLRQNQPLSYMYRLSNTTWYPFAGNFNSDIVSGTALAYNWNGLTTNTFIDFTGIPSWVKRVTVLGQGVSTSGTSAILWRVGSGSIVSIGYQSTLSAFAASSSSTVNSTNTTSFDITSSSAAAGIYNFKCTIELLGSNTYIATALVGRADGAAGWQETGAITLSGALDRVRITTLNGTDTFDAGSINILYE